MEIQTQVKTPSSIFGKKESKVAIQETPMSIYAQSKDSSSSLIAAKIAKENSLLVIQDKEVVMFGSDRQKAIGAKLDDLLAEITKGDSPVLFELFNQLKKGVGEANLSQLELQIRESMQTKWWHKILDSVKLSSVAKRIQSANGEISAMLTGKSKSLLDLTRNMESSIQTEVIKLINDNDRLNKLAKEYRQNILDFGDYVEAGKFMLSEAQSELLKKQEAAQTPLEIEEVKIFEQRINLFENRLLVLENVYAAAPAELESIRLSQGASYSTLAEVASNSLQEFNSIKSTLIKLSVSFQIKTVQSMNDERRKLRDSLSKYGETLLEDVSVKAAQMSGINRLEDAEKLLESASKLNEISNKVIAENKANKERYALAREKLSKAKILIESQ